jgi:riboflavin kinase / FMN adenylyltransferase
VSDLGSEAARKTRMLDDVDRQPSAVTVGFFDGVHRGHQAIIRRARRHAGGRLRTVVLTFDRHPMATIAPDKAPKLLMTHSRRLRTLWDQEVDEVVALPFTREVAGLAPDAFVEQVLVGRLGAEHVVVGANFRFGRAAAGDRSTLEDLGGRLGFSVDGVSILSLAGTAISSSEIRSRVGSGDVEWASRALGRPHVLEGPVVKGAGRGRDLGVPTVNIDVGDEVVIPGHGIYAGHVWTPSGCVPAAASIGVRPTFSEEEVAVEAHLIDWDGDLYGAHVALELRHRLRDERAFTTVEDLIAQMRRDIDAARTLLGGAGR